MSSRPKDLTTFPYKLTAYKKPQSKNERNILNSFKEPAGISPVEKIATWTQVGGGFGVVAGLAEALFKYPPHILSRAGIVCTGAATLGGIGFMYGIGTQLSPKLIPSDDDKIHHIVGGFMAGIPFGARMRNPWYGLLFGSLAACAGLTFRHVLRTDVFTGFAPNPDFSRERSFNPTYFRPKYCTRPHEEGKPEEI